MDQLKPYPPFDAELAVALADLDPSDTTMTADMIPHLREGLGEFFDLPMDEILAQHQLVCEDTQIPSFDGEMITVAVIRRADGKTSGVGFYHLHGGGMVLGDRFLSVASFAAWIYEHEAVMVSTEYRLAPENPDPIPIEDCFAGLQWMAANAKTLGVDPNRIVVMGFSAGGGLAAGVALLARDRGGPHLMGQVLACPMLDDRNTTVSSHQIDGVGVWDRASNIMGWTALLGDRRGGGDVSIYAAPSRATDLSNLAPAYIDCGSSEVFRDEDVDYALRIWQAGGSAELHVWSGGFHGYEDYHPDAAISHATKKARDSWIRRLIAQTS